jgi:hypothetical protein
MTCEQFIEMRFKRRPDQCSKTELVAFLAHFRDCEGCRGVITEFEKKRPPNTNSEAYRKGIALMADAIEHAATDPESTY